MKILISEKLSQNRFKTSEGYLICDNAILARTGKQTYLRKELFGDSTNNPDKEIEVMRTSDEVFSEKTLASFENKPITVEHPDTDVNSTNYNEFAVGFVRDVYKGISNGQEVMLGTLVITNAQTIQDIESGKHTNLSCGYECDIVDNENPKQTNIRGNHVALCETPRAGITRIIDTNLEVKNLMIHDSEVTISRGAMSLGSDSDIKGYEHKFNVKIEANEQKATITGSRENLNKFIDYMIPKNNQENIRGRIIDSIQDKIKITAESIGKKLYLKGEYLGIIVNAGEAKSRIVYTTPSGFLAYVDKIKIENQGSITDSIKDSPLRIGQTIQQGGRGLTMYAKSQGKSDDWEKPVKVVSEWPISSKGERSWVLSSGETLPQSLLEIKLKNGTLRFLDSEYKGFKVETEDASYTVYAENYIEAVAKVRRHLDARNRT